MEDQNSKRNATAPGAGVMVKRRAEKTKGKVKRKERKKLLRRITAHESAPATGTAQAPTNIVAQRISSEAFNSSVRNVGNSNGEFSL